MLPSTIGVYVASRPVDLRKGFEGLSNVVQTGWGQDPLSGDIYVFYNRRADQVRILTFDRTGYLIISKKLARGRFGFASRVTKGSQCIEMEWAELTLILEGIDLQGAKRRKRWRPHKKAA